MACGDYTVFFEYFANGQPFDAIYCVFQQQLGVVAPLLIIAPLVLGLALVSSSMAVPLVVVIILGGVLVPQLPGPAVQIIAIAVLLGITVAAFIIVKRTEGRVR